MTDPTPTSAEAVAHILGLRHMSGDDLHLPSAADFIERLVAENDALRDAVEAALLWDKDRGFVMPYRVRDPLVAAGSSKSTAIADCEEF